MSNLRKLVEDAQTIIVRPESPHADQAVDDPNYMRLLVAIRGLKDRVELSQLSIEELGSLRTLLKVAVHSATMTSRGAQLNLRAAYTALVKQALIRMGSVGEAVRASLEDLVDAANMVGPKEAHK